MSRSGNNRHTQHEGVKDNAWRKLLAATVDAYLSPAYDPEKGVNSLKIAQSLGIAAVAGPSLDKLNVFAPAAAAIHLQTRNWVEGAGNAAEVSPLWLPGESIVFNKKDLFGSATAVLRDSYHKAAVTLESAGNTHVGHFLDTFDYYAQTGVHANSHTIRKGGTLAFELAHFSRVTARALSNSELTRGYDEAQRVNAAHQLLGVFNSRASQDLESTTLATMSWPYAEREGTSIGTVEAARRPADPRKAELAAAKAAGRATLLELLGADGKDLFPAALELVGAYTPILKCPAHQRIQGSETALQTQLHAGVNFLAEKGLFHPDFPVPPVEGM
jgi:hypothetical protein